MLELTLASEHDNKNIAHIHVYKQYESEIRQIELTVDNEPTFIDISAWKREGEGEGEIEVLYWATEFYAEEDREFGVSAAPVRWGLQY